jgi:hypothetical protein
MKNIRIGKIYCEWLRKSVAHKICNKIACDFSPVVCLAYNHKEPLHYSVTLKCAVINDNFRRYFVCSRTTIGNVVEAIA